GCGIIQTEAKIKYLGEMYMHDQLEIGVRIVAMGRLSFTMRYRIERDGKATAEGETVLACFDYQAKRPRRFSPEFRQSIEAFEGDALNAAT
ncbi:MAG: thioesterase family protein, partial [Desulfuromonadales bacterium]|nr:thioesterase family protein [Desulfuromonadales bacterium]